MHEPERINLVVDTMNQPGMKLENDRDSTGRRKSLSLLAFAPKHESVGAIVSSML